MTKTLPISKAREELPTLVDRAQKMLDEFVITVKGTPAAVILSATEYESWKETNDISSNPDLVKAVKQGEEDFKNGDYITFKQLKKRLKINV